MINTSPPILFACRPCWPTTKRAWRTWYYHQACAAARNRCTLSSSSSEPHERYMRQALTQAHKAYALGEVPVGAVLAGADGSILGSGHNLVEGRHDVTQHAELVALRAFTTSVANWRVPKGSTLYCTLEPCAMCLSALSLARVDAIVYGADDLRLGACGTWIALHEETHPFHDFRSVTGGVLQRESSDLLVRFFRERRRERHDGTVF